MTAFHSELKLARETIRCLANENLNLKERNQHLLEANNRYLQRARDAEATLKLLDPEKRARHLRIVA